MLLQPIIITQGSWSDLDYKSTCGESSAVNKNAVDQSGNSIVKEYSISDFFNPNNPSTNIFNQMPGECYLTLRFDDMLGRELGELLKSVKAPG